MPTPRFSIIIPTRNRSQTLYYSLKTCLTQSFASFEIVVCDNFSTPETKQVIDSFASDKIKYIRSDAPLAMSDNWELAISHANGEYVIFIGDDDGLLPNALTDLDLFITAKDAKAIRWAMSTYIWPDVQGGLAANKLHIPIPTPSTLIDSHEAIEAVLKGEKNYSFLPMLYYSAIHQDIIQTLKSRTGKVFKGSSPDVYSGFVVGYLAKTHYMLGKPLGIVGYSGKSNGVATLIVKEETAVAKEFNQLNESAGQTLHGQVPNLPVLAAATANEFLNAKQALFPNDNQFILDRKQTIINCIKDLENFNRVGKKEWNIFINIIATSLSDDKDLQKWFDKTYVQHYTPKGTPWVFSQEAWQDRLTTDSMFLDGSTFGVADVFGAAELCGKLIGHTMSISDLTSQPESSQDLHQQLIEKERVIQQFHRELIAREQVIQAFRSSFSFGLVNGPLFQIAMNTKKRLKSFFSAK